MKHKATLIIAFVAAVLLASAAVGLASARRADALSGDAVTITSATVDPKAGVIRVEGTIRCSAEEEGELALINSIVVSQRQGNRVVSAYDETGALCTEQPSSFVVRMAAFEPDGTPLHLHPGRATVSGTIYISGPGGVSMPMDPIEVRLEPSRFV